MTDNSLAYRELRQLKIAGWCLNAFGVEQARSLPQRGLRLLEEAIEAYQACGADKDMAHRLVDFVFSRPPGELSQEIGGVGVTLLALSDAAGFSADTEEIREVSRVLAKPLEHFQRRNEEKNAAGFDAVTAKRAMSADTVEIEGEIDIERGLQWLWLVRVVKAPCAAAEGKKVFLPTWCAQIVTTRQDGLREITTFSVPKWLATENALA